MANKVALVTGSGKRRIGSYIADALAERDYRMVIHYQSSEAEAHERVSQYKARGIEATALQADFTDDAAAGSMIESILAKYGRLDVVVNAAAVYKSKKLEEITAADVRMNFEVNTIGTFICSMKAGLAMVRQPEGGNIITFDDWAEIRPYLNYAAYLPSKGAIPALTRTLAVELGTRNPSIRVNCIVPGPILFPPDLPQAERDEAISATLVRHAGHPRNIVQAVLFFIENDFVTGVCLPVDGGRSIFAKGL